MRTCLILRCRRCAHLGGAGHTREHPLHPARQHRQRIRIRADHLDPHIGGDPGLRLVEAHLDRLGEGEAQPGDRAEDAVHGAEQRILAARLATRSGRAGRRRYPIRTCPWPRWRGRGGRACSPRSSLRAASAVHARSPANSPCPGPSAVDGRRRDWTSTLPSSRRGMNSRPSRVPPMIAPMKRTPSVADDQARVAEGACQEGPVAFAEALEPG